MVCTTKVGSVVKLEDCIYLSLVCGDKKRVGFCISEIEYELIGSPKPGEVVDFYASSEREIVVRFLGSPAII
jgi:hypothetical protein